MNPQGFNTANTLCAQCEKSDTWRLAISLAIALGVHAALITVPVSLAPTTASSSKSPLKIILSGDKNTEILSAPNTEHSAMAVKPRKLERLSADKANKAEPSQPKTRSRPIAETQALSNSAPKPQSPSMAGSRTIEIPADSAAKSRSTIFNPELAKKLARARNKVRKFEQRDSTFQTTTGTFVQQGDRCWEVKQLIPGDTSIESSQWLRNKCPGSSRSQSDIDRLAEKYGIP